MFGKFSLSGTAADNDDCHSAVAWIITKRKEKILGEIEINRTRKEASRSLYLLDSFDQKYPTLTLNNDWSFVFFHLPRLFLGNVLFLSCVKNSCCEQTRANRTSCRTFRSISIHRETFRFIHRNHDFHWASWFKMGAINKVASLVNQSIDVSIAYFKENAVAIIALILSWRYLRGIFNDRCKHYKYQMVEPWPCCVRVNSFSLSNILVVTTFFFQIPTAGRPKDIPYLRRPQNQKQSKIAIVKKKWEKLGNASKKLPTNAPKRRPFWEKKRRPKKGIERIRRRWRNTQEIGWVMEDLGITLRDLLLRAAVVFVRMTTIQCNRGTPAHPLIGKYCTPLWNNRIPNSMVQQE